MNQNDIIKYLQDGASQSYDEFQRRFVQSQLYLKQQEIALGQSDIDRKSATATLQARQAAVENQVQTNNAIASVGIQIKSLTDLNNLSQQMSKDNINALLFNADQIKQAGLTDMNKATKALFATVGDVRSSYGGSLIAADTGSAKDLTNSIIDESQSALTENYKVKLNQASEQINNASKVQLQQQYQDLSTNSKIYLAKLSLNTALRSKNPLATIQNNTPSDNNL